MKKTAFQELVDIIDKADNIDEVRKQITFKLKDQNVNQILDAFNEGMKYGQSILPTFDYPASRYYNYTYNNPENK